MSNRRILVVDDEKEVRKLLKGILEEYGCEVETARDGWEALALLELDIDLVLTDVAMPGMDGFELVFQIRNDERHKHLPVIMVTGLTSMNERMRAAEVGANDFIAKPFDLVEIKLRTASLLEMKQARDALNRHREELEQVVAKRTKALKRTLTRMVSAQRELRSAQIETIHRLVAVTEFKDVDTANHIQRMSLFSAMLARVIGLAPSEVELVRYASPMHDIGKVSTPIEVLLKPAKLNDEEWKIMKRHTVVGGEILRNSDSQLLQAGEVIALTHHEKWDGSGYPNGLAGEDIPIWGRLCATADVFDALTSKRPYKKAFTNERALEIVNESAGSHLDPNLVEVLNSNMAEVEEIQASAESE